MSSVDDDRRRSLAIKPVNRRAGTIDAMMREHPSASLSEHVERTIAELRKQSLKPSP
jgi:hypothetical protein